MYSKLKAFTRIVIPNFLLSTLVFIKISSLSKDSKTLKKINFNKVHNKAIVLGNGPSLKNDLDDIASKKDNYDVICVNNFCSSPYYEVFKPVMYVFLDGYFFSDDAHIDWVEQREKTFKIINETTNWPMQIFLPANADESILKDIITNENIQIIKFRVSQFVSENLKLNDFMYATGFFGPYQCNVLIYAIYLAVWARYNIVDIYGADLSFHNDVQVNQINNKLYMTFKHFNSKDKIEFLRRGYKKEGNETMFYMLDGQAKTFKAHELIESFSEKLDVKIYNKSSVSLIDAYSRGLENE